MTAILAIPVCSHREELSEKNCEFKKNCSLDEDLSRDLQQFFHIIQQGQTGKLKRIKKNEYEVKEVSFVSSSCKIGKQVLQMPVMSFTQDMGTAKYPQTDTKISPHVLHQP